MDTWEREWQERQKAREEERLKREELEKRTMSKREVRNALNLSSREVEQVTVRGRLRCTETTFDSRYEIAEVEALRKEFHDLSMTTFTRDEAMAQGRLPPYKLDAAVQSGAVRTARDPLGRIRYLREDILGMGRGAPTNGSAPDLMDVMLKLVMSHLKK
jgi:hypothetical protein